VTNRKRDTGLGPANRGDGCSDLDELLREVTDRQDADMLDDMIQLVEALSAVLRPVSASPQFLNDLSEGLAAAAVPAEITVGRSTRRRSLWLGAILSGSLVSAMGVLFVWFMRRNRRSPILAS
jgi:hypothetical protein